MVDLSSLNLALDLLLKPLAIVVLIGIALLLKDLDQVVKSFERSAESIENTAGTVEELTSIARKIPFISSKRRDIDVE